MFKNQFINRKSGEIFTLSTPYTDQVEACICGQNYCRDRQQEDGTVLFFRVITVGEYYEPEQEDCDEDEDDCDGDCYRCGLCCEDENEEDSEEPDWEQLFEEWNFNPLFFLRVSN